MMYVGTQTQYNKNSNNDNNAFIMIEKEGEDNFLSYDNVIKFTTASKVSMLLLILLSSSTNWLQIFNYRFEHSKKAHLVRITSLSLLSIYQSLYL